MTTRNLHRQIFWLIAAGAFVLLLSLWLVSPPVPSLPRKRQRNTACPVMEIRT